MDKTNRRRHAAASLRHRDMSLLTTASAATMVGQQLEGVTVAWQVYTMTDSAVQLGLLALVRAIPMLALALAGGAIADRIDRRRILRVSQTVHLISIGLLASGTFFGWLTPAVIYVLATLTAAAVAFDSPARYALIPRVVPRSELANAFTINTLARESAFVIGPAIGGFIIGWSGIAAAYASGAIAYIIGAIALLAVRQTTIDVQPLMLRGADAILGGLRFMKREHLLASLLIVAVPGQLFSGLEVLLPIFARDVLSVGPEGLGLLHGARGFGAVLGTLVLGGIGAVGPPVASIVIAIAVHGLGLICFGLSTSIVISIGLLLLIGAASVVSEVARATLTMAKTPDELRGRVTALQQVVFQGGPRLGGMNIGFVVAAVGPVAAAVVGGTVVLAMALAATRFQVIKRNWTVAP